MERKWEELTPEEKREERFKRCLEPPDVKFISPEAEQAYKARRKRLVDAYQLKEPDRVPVVLPAGSFPVYHAGVTLQTVMYDFEELRRVWRKFLNEFEMDTFWGPGMAVSSVDHGQSERGYHRLFLRPAKRPAPLREIRHLRCFLFRRRRDFHHKLQGF